MHIILKKKRELNKPCSGGRKQIFLKRKETDKVRAIRNEKPLTKNCRGLATKCKNFIPTCSDPDHCPEKVVERLKNLSYYLTVYTAKGMHLSLPQTFR